MITYLGYFIRDLITPTNLVMPYLLGVVLIAVLFGRGPAVFASVLGVVVFDIFLVPPYLTLVVEDTEYIITFLALFVVSVVISNLTSQIKDQMQAAQEREARVVSLYNLSNDLAVAYSSTAVTEALIENIKHTLQHNIWIFLAALGDTTTATPHFEVIATPGAPARSIDPAILYTYERGLVSGYHTEAFSNADTINLPLITNSGNAGVLSVAVNGPRGSLSAEKFQLFEAYANLFALALERIYLSNQAHEAQLLRAKEEFQSTLLNSVSHDFRTPLVTITGTLSSLDADLNRLDREAQINLVRNALSEAEKLNRLVGNLLNMSRLESGAMQLQTEALDLQDLIGSTLEQMKNRMHRPVMIEIPDDIPMICGDFVLLEQALMNILDNAVKYSPEDSPITIAVCQENEQLHLKITDQGMGISENELPHIFEKFYRVKDGARPSGTGLGLAIVKGILDIHQAEIRAYAGEPKGMVFEITFPVSDPPYREVN
ncbi:MAG: DUF4118 domain-containing protein [Anaerolineales bacterium]|nr:DUF4118 domain-containing protein [Anaerolineales bacterium]